MGRLSARSKVFAIFLKFASDGCDFSSTRRLEMLQADGAGSSLRCQKLFAVQQKLEDVPASSGTVAGLL